VPFTYSVAEGRYRDAATGALVPEASIRRALDQVLSGSAQTMRGLTQSLIDGQMSLATWQSSMMLEVKAANLIGATVGIGGWAQMDQSDFGWTGQRIRTQYAFLRGFAADLASGRQKLNGSVLARAELYAEAGRQTHRAAVEREAKARGEEQERNVLGAADHCQSCLAQTARGWVGIGELVPCGSRDCKVRCHCSIEYRVKAPAMAA
jgi:hypothetical protein